MGAEIVESEVDALPEGGSAGETGGVDVGGGAEEAPEAVEAPESGAEEAAGGEDAPEGGEKAGVEAEKAAEDGESDPEGGESGDSEEENPWNGEISSLHTQDWFAGLPDADKKSVSDGLDRIRKGMDRAFHTKMQGVSDFKDRLLERERTIVELLHDDKDFKGTIDDLVDAVLEERLAERTSDLEKQLEEARSGGAKKSEIDALNEKLAKVEAEKAELAERATAADQKIQAFESMAEAAREAELAAMADETENFLKEHAADVLDNDEALEFFFALPSSCESPEGNQLALKMLRIQYPAPEPETVPDPEPEEVPDSVDLMGSGSSKDTAVAGGGKGGWSHIDEEIKREKRRQGLA